jgi:hypothetical protein
MSSGTDIYGRVVDEIVRYRVRRFYKPSLIELSDADYDAIVEAATYYDEGATEPAAAKNLHPATTPREGGSLFGFPLRADSTLVRGQARVT